VGHCLPLRSAWRDGPAEQELGRYKPYTTQASN